MTKRFTTEFKVGAFTLVALAALAYMLILLNSRFLSSKKTTSYYTLTSNAKGVVSMTNVRTSGVTVGQVTDILLEDQLTQIHFEIDGGVSIPVGSKVELRSRGLLGETFLEIIRAPDEGRYVPSGGMIPMNTKSVDFFDLVGVMGSIAEDIQKITASLSHVLVSKEADGENPLQRMVFDMEQSLAQIKDVIQVNRPQIQQSLDHIFQITENLAEFTQGDPLADFRSLALNVSSVMGEVKETVREVQDVVQGVGEGKGTVGTLLTDENLVEDIRSTVAGVREFVAPAQSLNVRVKYHNEVRSDNSFQQYLAGELQFRRKRFYLLGVTSFPESVVQSSTITREEKEGSQVVLTREERRRERDALRFQAQIGHRFGDLSLRFGLFESSGGVGGDYHLFNDQLRLSLEVYNWRRDADVRAVAQWKAYGFWYLLPYLHVNFGLADITRKAEDGQGDLESMRPFVGGGFHFDDEDLKKVLGTASFAF